MWSAVRIGTTGRSPTLVRPHGQAVPRESRATSPGPIPDRITAGDRVGNLVFGFWGETLGDYLVHSFDWKNGSLAAAGAVTWCDGAKGTVGIVTASNSVVGGSPMPGIPCDSISSRRESFFWWATDGQSCQRVRGGRRVRAGNRSPATRRLGARGWKSKRSFGTAVVKAKKGKIKSFQIRNTGSKSLTGIKVLLRKNNKKDFKITRQPPVTIAPGNPPFSKFRSPRKPKESELPRSGSPAMTATRIRLISSLSDGVKPVTTGCGHFTMASCAEIRMPTSWQKIRIPINMRRTAFVVCMVLVSCERSHPSANDQGGDSDQVANHEPMSISPDQAKGTILEMIGSNGLLDGLDGAVERIQNAEVRVLDEGMIRFDSVTCNLKEKSFVLEIIAPPKIAIYHGHLEFVNGRWEAEIVRVTRN